MLRADALPATADPVVRERAPARGFARTWVLATGVFVVALVVLGLEARAAGFEGDEADYTATSRYFGYLFLQRDPWRDEWGGNHWTRTQPPLTRYIIGGWLAARGYDLEALNQPYVSTASSLGVNRRKGRVPTDDVLAAARQPMVLLGAGAIAVLFGLGSLLGGPVAGLATAGLALSSGFMRYTLVHAWAEAPLSFLLTLAALLAALCAARIAGGRPWVGYALAAGLALGLAATTKLTGYVGLAATVALALMTAAVVGWCRRGSPSAGRPPPGAAPRTWLAAGVLAGAVAVAVTVALNPFLWRNPVRGLAEMLIERRDEMAAQQEQWPEFAVLDWRDRPGLTTVGVTRFGPWDEVPAAAVAVNAGLALVGVGGLAGAARLGACPPFGWAPAIVLGGWLAAYLAAIVGGLGLSYPRYFLPGCLFVLPFAAAGVAALADALGAATRRAR